MADPERHIEFERASNFRDAGGYRTAGGRSVRWRRLFRAGALHRMTDADAKRARSKLGVVTVIDLRRDDESPPGGDGLGPLVSAVRHYPLPVIPYDGSGRSVVDMLDAAVGRGISAERYAQYLRLGGGQFARAIELLADGANYPAVVHCSAGKDRTGVLVAMLLELLGVDEETIVADYALSNRGLGDRVARLRENGRLRGDASSPDEMQRLYGAPPGAMAGFLVLLRAEHGSARGFLASQGVEDATFARLEELLLE